MLQGENWLAAYHLVCCKQTCSFSPVCQELPHCRFSKGPRLPCSSHASCSADVVLRCRYSLLHDRVQHPVSRMFSGPP